jgi:hypothetical protein
MLRTIRFAAFVTGAALMASPVLAQSSPVVGQWATAIESDFGKFEATMTVAQTASGYTVDIKDAPRNGPDGAPAPAMQSTVSDVAVDGSKLTFKRALTTPQGPMTLSYSATVDGNALTGEVGSDFGAMKLSGTRQ